MKSHIERESVGSYLILLFPRKFNILKQILWSENVNIFLNLTLVNLVARANIRYLVLYCDGISVSLQGFKKTRQCIKLDASQLSKADAFNTTV